MTNTPTPATTPATTPPTHDRCRPGRPAGERFRPRDWLDRVFEIGIIAKGLNGLLELVGGVLLLLVSPGSLYHLAVRLTTGELSEDPRDPIARSVLQTAGGLNTGNLGFGAAYLLVHGLVKVVLVLALLKNWLWAYPAMIAVLLAFIGYQVYRITLSPGLGLVALTAFDLIIVALTAVEFGRQRARRVSGRAHTG